MKILKLHEHTHNEVIQKAVKVLQRGELVVYPTETVYGVGVDATNQKAVDALLQYKSRREGKPLSIAVANASMAAQYAQINQQASALYKQFLPGPMTVISKDLGKLADGVASEFNSIGIRIPDYPLVREIVRDLGTPITATSANASGKRRPYTIQHILDNLSEKQKSHISLIIDAGELPRREPSQVIDTTLSIPVSVRAGSGLLKSSNTMQLVSQSEQETMAIAGKIMLQHWNSVSTTGVLIGLEGELGAGKTIFTKGVAEFLKINETITSPTYSYIEEYPFQRHTTHGMLYHIDAWKLQSRDEVRRLRLAELLRPKTVVVIEWFSQVVDAMPAPTCIIEVREKDASTRVLKVTE
ncbi:MAG: threonylcarbamoyl-AMP synthase [Pseudomonadales bacterium]|nr:threonylcarbamoyl-AMP synthase [Candidatus Woesebacteria bacterium]MCB9801467.1 threonylcarbamoyl-AMP synthase [Pseudomonadales bacterium]